MPDEFEIEISDRGRNGVVVAVRGDIDLFTTPEFKDAVARALSRSTNLLVIDLTRATFMDSSSLGVLIGAHRRMHQRGGRLVVACDQPAILKVLRVTGLDGVFDMVGAAPHPHAAAASAR